ncbi:MAG: tRNA 2-thiocytidine(32) synthetase TtcA [Leptospiraceae bacterium]|nr:tRNA 2-thiocytidine(32) synthetase TtcA [Leptospiraceae bacterium]MDW7976947.1 tRNA 2-thiocytidine(32) synthetase TtcA [Leptospiraceae bacterium]
MNNTKNITNQEVHPKTLERKIRRKIGKALSTYPMIQNGDKILVAVSGGKDSLTLLYFLKEFQQKAPLNFSFVAFHLLQGQPGEDPEPLQKLFEKWNVPYRIAYQNTYQIVKEKIPPHKTYCSLCSRLRRGILTRYALELGCNSIALGHHKDDVIETLLLNLFFESKFFSMRPVYKTKKEGIKIIRPLFFVDEESIKQFAKQKNFPILPCNLCNSLPNSKRLKMKKLLSDLSKDHPIVKHSLFHSFVKSL